MSTRFKVLDEKEYYSRCKEFQDKSDEDKRIALKEETDNVLAYLGGRGFGINEITGVARIILNRAKVAQEEQAQGNTSCVN